MNTGSDLADGGLINTVYVAQFNQSIRTGGELAAINLTVNCSDSR